MESKRKTELAQRLRGDVGSPNQTSLPEPQLLQALESARREYSKYRGPLTIGNFDTVANQDEYPYDLDVVCFVIDVLPAVNSLQLESFVLSEGVVFSDSHFPGDVSVYDNPSLLFMRKLKDKMQRQFGGTWEDRGVKEVGDPLAFKGIIALMPAPKETGQKVYYEYRKWVTFEQIPPRDEDLLMLWAQAESMEKMATSSFSTGAIRSVSGGGQTISYGGGTTADMKNEIRSRRSEFNLKVSI